MSRIITRLLALFLLCLFHPVSAGAQQGDRPFSLKLGDAVVTGFSGTLAPAPGKPHPRNKSATDFTFINPDGPSVRVIDVSRPGYVWDGRLFAAPKTFDVFAKDVGQVFGIALDDSTPPNIYVAATSVFGLNIVVRGREGKPERRKNGAPGAGWMKGQFGLDLQGGPGAIYKIDGRTGVPALFANVTLNGVPNPGPGLGSLAYDSAHKQLIVSDLHTGMIHRFALDGKELGAFDHGVTGLGAAKLAPVAFNPANRPNIASDRFDSEKPDTWGFAPAARRVWGLAVHEGRLYYSVVSGPQIWSVGIERDGGFAADPRWEYDVPAQAGPLPISDIAFSQKGAMILAQRALIAGAYDYSTFTRPGEPQVLRVWLKGPNDSPSPGRWKLVPEEYATGFAGNDRNSNGGVALGYGYGQDGMLAPQACEAALWTTGQNLRNNPVLRSQLEPGGPLLVHGLQGSPADLVRNANTPPATSYFVDYDDKFDDPRASGHMGSVRIFAQPCAGAVAVSSPAGTASPAGGGGGGGGGGACYPANQPTSLSLPPLSLPPCTQPGQPVSLDLSTATFSSGVDPSWAVTPFGPQGYSTQYLPPWNVLQNNWIQPKQSVVAQNHPVGTYVYTRTFNLTCRPESYRSLKLTGHFGSDNSGMPALNGNSLPPGSSNAYHSPPTPLGGVPFSHTGPSFFVPGLNVLTVTVQNLPPGGRTGMTMIAKLEAICGPDCVCGCPEGTVLVDGKCEPTKPIDLKVDKENTPSQGGGTWFNVWVTNVGPPITFPAGAITITENIPANMTVTGVTGTGWTCVPPTMVGPGTMLCTYNLAGTLPTNTSLSNTMVVHYTTTGPGPFINCAIVGIGSSVGVDTNPSNDKACAEVTGTPVDVKIEKTGGTTPFCPAPYYSFTIKVTNGPNPWPGTGNIVVSDTVPANMTFGPIASPGWTCPLGIIPAGTTFTCTYTGPALTANQVLPVITIPATPTVGPPFPPYTNCASVAIASSSGYADSNSSNNNSCTTVSKPSSCACPPPQVLNSDGICACPQGQILVGGACVPPPPTCTAPQVLNVDGICACPPPMLPGAVPGQCICPQGQVLVGGACVPRPPTCTPPQVLNVDGICACPAPMLPGAVPGQCICPQGQVLVGGACALPAPAGLRGPAPAVCPPPKVPDSNGKCICPPTMMDKDGVCVAKPDACRPPKTLNAATGLCECPAGTIDKGGQCVPPSPACVSPTHMNQLTGKCECAPGVLPGGTTPFIIKKVTPWGVNFGTGIWSFDLVCTGPTNTNTSVNVYMLTAGIGGINIPVATCSMCTVTEQMRPIPQGNCPAGTWATLAPPTYAPSSVVTGVGTDSSMGNANVVTVTNNVNCSSTPPVCQWPLVSGPGGLCQCAPLYHLVGGRCVKEGPRSVECQAGTKLIEGVCVPPPVCFPPQVLNSNGACGCPAPMLPGAVPGQCKCPQGSELAGGLCKPIVRKQPEKVKKQQACPEGTIKKGSKCVKRERKGVTGDDVRRGIDIIRGIPGSSGGGRGSNSGGGSSPGKR